jgi:hypothetical protein
LLVCVLYACFLNAVHKVTAACRQVVLARQLIKPGCSTLHTDSSNSYIQVLARISTAWTRLALPACHTTSLHCQQGMAQVQSDKQQPCFPGCHPAGALLLMSAPAAAAAQGGPSG